MKKRNFYVTDFNANGLQDILIADCDGNIVATRSSCIYGFHVRQDRGQIVLNTVIITDPEMRKSLLDTPNELTYVYPANPEVLMRHLAVGIDAQPAKTQDFINKHRSVGF